VSTPFLIALALFARKELSDKPLGAFLVVALSLHFSVTASLHLRSAMHWLLRCAMGCAIVALSISISKYIINE
jgi:hypothetical protein